MTGEFSSNRDTFFEKNNSNKGKFLPQIVVTFFYMWFLLFETVEYLLKVIFLFLFYLKINLKRLRANIRKECILHIRSEAPSAQKKKDRRKERRQKI
ncbi:hypothetical protein BpHYR1_020644 [Brachionus plicatilis]|uniref:Uncharacterized protein n=1 Tax=Brachionus plicatilis TaxID=10195 RepID=A0A3M7QC50_BRAPC|nr:hypothetical protein BpHYR1_020644 [Brachionus plicatilis]